MNRPAPLSKIYILTLGLLLTFSVNAEAAGCHGKFVNPITDVCWSCIFPISIGNTPIYSGGREDTPNPSSPLCLCNRPPAPFPIPGISIGIWEPARLLDVVRKPYCMVGLGGVELGNGVKKHGGVAYKSNNEALKHSFYHVHMYFYPLLSWFEILMDFACMDKGSIDVLYMSEFDPWWNNDEANAILNPEALLFTNPVAQAACAGDCAAASSKRPIDSFYWCAGCQGNLYPLTGFIENHVGGVESSTLIAERTIARMHRVMLARKTSSSSKPLCKSELAPLIKKSQYKLQMTYPLANTKGKETCNFLGKTTMAWGSGREFPSNGEDYGYLLWRKRNCCLL